MLSVLALYIFLTLFSSYAAENELRFFHRIPALFDPTLLGHEQNIVMQKKASQTTDLLLFEGTPCLLSN